MGSCESKNTDELVLYSLSVSYNSVPVSMLAADCKVGRTESVNLMDGSHKKPAYLAINPFGAVPSLAHGDFCIAETTACLRYIARNFGPQYYSSLSIKQQATVDWVLDWLTSSFMKNFQEIVHPVLGFSQASDKRAQAVKDATEGLDTFTKKFLSGGGKFLCGNDLTIADYRLGVLCWYLSFPNIKASCGFDLSPRLRTYVKDFLQATPSSATCMSDAEAMFKK
mmetsp:Transcript_13282/g.29250  ORF Transcript_13282/g.29250 Transcript_13282/m.29250 type:complete len:224 (-) Transcript_13282:165-836(-)|eukprot:CAMPEP_0170581662 /NCGR_PEP_ID=MMETSP0224-20130122/7161_1 /TAXON_ID=285029 /ORGANISM="Togula jolla, Strain CCCM 725" /LENGTH=223 /DNA_ID=CAMNT_0010904817 /DNA_START=72 /DNA_END=743 /DNA_ORIENTATION=-